jgi:hypothetical protein
VCEADHSHPSSTEVKNDRSCTSTLPNLLMAVTGTNMLPFIMLIPSSLLYTNMGVDKLGNLEVDDRFKDVECVRVAGYSVHAVI